MGTKTDWCLFFINKYLVGLDFGGIKIIIDHAFSSQLVIIFKSAFKEEEVQVLGAKLWTLVNLMFIFVLELMVEYQTNRSPDLFHDITN